jgi:hypothetical protein
MRIYNEKVGNGKKTNGFIGELGIAANPSVHMVARKWH